MQVISHCPTCFAATPFPGDAAPAEVACRRCGVRRAVTPTESVRERNVVDRCILCGCGHLYIEKDFNGYVGFGIIVGAIVASGIAWARSVPVALGILGGAALVDLLFWVISKERTVCYRCVAIYRSAAANPAHGRYELGTAGRFADDYDEQREQHQK